MRLCLLLSSLFISLWLQAQNVGIGTTNPLHALHVTKPAGNTNVLVQAIQPADYAGYTLEASTRLSDYTRWGLAAGGTTAGVPTANLTRLFADNGPLLLGNSGDHSLHFVTNTLERMRISNSGHVSIGTNTPHPTGKVHIDMTGSFSDGFLVTGTNSYDPRLGLMPDLGSGSRMMFYPAKGAFRAGYAGGSAWDNSNTGAYSVALGLSPIARGFSSIALGNTANAYGDGAVAIGDQVTATGRNATAMGEFATASGENSFAIGYDVQAKGNYSSAIGGTLVAKGYASTVVGLYNDSLLTTDETTESDATPVFIVGNGHGFPVVTRSNAFVVRKDGKVGVGNIVPEYTLDVANRMRLRGVTGDAANSAGIWLNNINNTARSAFIGVLNDNHIGFFGNTGSGWSMVMNTSTGNMGIGTATPSQKLHVAGNICATGSIGACSDIRYKMALQPVHNALQAVLSLNAIYYQWKPEFTNKGFTPERQLGFSAQEVERFFPEIVQTDAEGYKAVDYSRFAPVLVEAIKEQQRLIKELQTEITLLKKQVQK